MTNKNDNNGLGLEGKVAIVTGSGGVGAIGHGIAKALARNGVKLMLADLKERDVQNVIQDISAETEMNAITYGGDLSDKQHVSNMVEQTMQKWGRIDILINNAGGGVILPFIQHTEETMIATINRNLWTTLWCCKMVIPIMMEQKYGRIVNIGAESVRNGLWDHAMYNAAKGGVHGLTTGLAREFAPYNITVNTVAPSGTLTDKVKKQEDKNYDYERVVRLIPMGRRAKVEEVSEVAVFLASDKSSFVTGQVVSVNGGSSML